MSRRLIGGMLTTALVASCSAVAPSPPPIATATRDESPILSASASPPATQASLPTGLPSSTPEATIDAAICPTLSTVAAAFGLEIGGPLVTGAAQFLPVSPNVSVVSCAYGNEGQSVTVEFVDHASPTLLEGFSPFAADPQPAYPLETVSDLGDAARSFVSTSIRTEPDEVGVAALRGSRLVDVVVWNARASLARVEAFVRSLIK